MRAFKASLLLMAVLAMFFSGCGTICNVLDREPEVYGGFEKDPLFRLLAADARGEGPSPSSPKAAILTGIVLAPNGI
jgi:hypothetical protein